MAEIHEIRMDSTFPNPNNKLEIRDLDVLVNSISKFGLETPITVFWNSKLLGYTIISGHRRYEACKKLGFKTIPANVIAEPHNSKDEFLKICAGNIARTSEEDIADQIKLASDQWENMTNEERDSYSEELKRLYIDRMGKMNEGYRPKTEYIRSITGINISGRQINRKLAEFMDVDEEKPETAPKKEKEEKKKKKSTARSLKAYAASVIEEGRYLTSEYADEMLDEETASDIETVINILSKYL